MLQIKRLLYGIVLSFVFTSHAVAGLNDELFKAVESGDISLIGQLLSKGVDINAKNEFGGITPLHDAVIRENFKVVKYLVSKGADINSKDINGLTPLHYAAKDGNLEVIRYLVSKGADVNAKDKFGATPLHYAAMKGSLNAVKYLISKGADVNAKDNSGWTPIYYAAMGGHFDVIKYLLSRGAVIKVKDIENWIPIRYVNNMEEFEDFIVNCLDNTANRAIVKIPISKYDNKSLEEVVGFWNVRIGKQWSKDDFIYFLIFGRKFKETNETFKKIMAELGAKLDEKSKGLDEKMKEQEEKIREISLDSELLSLIVYVFLGENVDLLRKHNWKFSRKRLKKLDNELDKINKNQISHMRVFTNNETFRTLMSALEILEQMHPDMKNLIEEIKRKIKSKKELLVKPN